MAELQRPDAEDESVRDLRKAILTLADVPKVAATEHGASTPKALRPREELLDPDIGRWSDLAQPGGFRRHHVRQLGQEQAARSHVQSSLLQLLDPSIALSYIEPGDDDDDDESPAAPLPVVARDAHAVAPEGSSSTLATAIIIAKLCFGSAVLVVPKGFRSAGLVLAPLLLLLVYVFMIAGLLRLIKCREAHGVRAHYQDLGVYLGKWGQTYIATGVVAMVFGFSCIWAVTCQENLKMILPHLGPTTRLFVFLPLVVPLCFFRKLKLFTVTNLLGITLCVSTWAYLIYFASERLASKGTAVVVMENTANADALLWLGTCGYVFELVGTVIPVYEAARDKKMVPRLLVGVTATVLVLYMSFGALFYLAFGEETGDLALFNLPEDSVAGILFPLFFCIVGVVTTPLNFFVIYQTYESHLSWPRGYHRRKWSKNAVRALIVAFAYIVTWAGGEQLQNFLALVGGLLGSNLALNLPAMLHIAICKPRGFSLAWDVLTFVVGLAVMVSSTYQAVHTWK